VKSTPYRGTGKGGFMATLIPEITISDFKKLKAHQLKRLLSCEVTSDGEYLFTFINPQVDYIRIQAEYKAQLSNSVGGESLEEVLKQEVNHTQL